MRLLFLSSAFLIFLFGVFMMKRTAAVILFFLLSLVSAFSSSNLQRYYAVGSTEWQTVNALCHTAGVTGPSSVGPVTAEELLLALSRAESAAGGNALIEDMKAKLTDDTALLTDEEYGTIDIIGDATPEFYAQLSQPFGKDYSEQPVYDLDEDWFIKNTRERKPIASITLENTIGSVFYSRFVLGIENTISRENDTTPYWNDFLSSQSTEFNIYRNFPDDGGISLGGKGLSLIIARGRLSVGEGYTGNTAVGDNFDWQEFMKASFYTRYGKVSLSLTTFDSSHDSSLKPYELLSSRFNGWRELRHSASYEITMFDTLRLSVTFVSHLDTRTALDIRYLNPFLILHNYFNYEKATTFESNNLMSLDFSWAIAPKWNLYGQISMDQVQLTSEVRRYVSEMGTVDPNAFGGLINLSYSDILGTGLLNVYAEFVYNMPGMYLNSKYYDEDGNVTQDRYSSSGALNTSCWSQDFLTGYKRTESDYDDIGYSTYLYGGDCLVVSLGASWRVPDTRLVKASVFYMAHGEKGRGTDPDNYTFEGINSENDLNRLSLTGTVEHSLVIKAEDEIKVWDSLSVSFGGAYSLRINYHNEDGRLFSNFQCYVGVRLTTKNLEI